MYSLAAPRTVALPCLLSRGIPSMRPVVGEGVSSSMVIGVEVPLKERGMSQDWRSSEEASEDTHKSTRRHGTESRSRVKPSLMLSRYLRSMALWSETLAPFLWDGAGAGVGCCCSDPEGDEPASEEGAVSSESENLRLERVEEGVGKRVAGAAGGGEGWAVTTGCAAGNDGEVETVAAANSAGDGG